MTSRKSGGIYTFSGRFFFPMDPRPEDVCIEDIAHSLSLKCRWTGQCAKLYCPTPDQRILDANLRWRPAGDLKVGDELLGFDEFPHEPGACGVRRRRFRYSAVSAALPVRRRIIRLELADGSTVRSSAEHPWLVATKQSRNQKWLTAQDIADDIAVGRRSYMHKFIEPWREETSHTAGWLAGIADGEAHPSFVGQGRKGKQLGISQNPCLVLDRVVDTLNTLGFPNTGPKDPRNGGSRRVVTVNGGWRSIARFLGSVRPVRLLDKFAKGLRRGQFTKQMDGSGLPLEIVKYYSEGEDWVSGIETTTRTYLCEGYGAHNSIAEHSLRVSNAAVALAVLDGVRDALRLNNIRIQALIHDAHEAYLADLASPLKSFIPNWRSIEDKIQDAIVEHLGLTGSDPGLPYVKQADLMLAWFEHKELFRKALTIDEIYFDRGDRLPWPTYPDIPAQVEAAAYQPYDNARDRLLASLKLICTS